jgi:DNA mismatch repair ATPase MutS
MEGVIISSVIFPAGFITFFILYEKNKKKLIHFQNLAKICQDELNALTGDFSAFDSGKEYISNKHYYSYDLDIFGDNSIFKSLNRTVTNFGKKTLADLLTNPNTNKDNILNLQESIKELSTNTELSMQFRAIGMETKDKTNDKQNILDLVNSEDLIYSSKWRKINMYLIPSINILLIIICALGKIPFSLVLLSSIFLFLISGYNIRKINQFHLSIGKKNRILQKYYKLLRLIEKTQPNSKILKEIKDNTSTSEKDAHKELKRLSFLIGALDNRLNFMLGTILNIVFLHDFHIILRIEKWKKHNKKNINLWFNSIGKMDALCSMATYAFNNENHIYPIPTDDCIINTTNMGHPLIPEKSRVNNNISINNIK